MEYKYKAFISYRHIEPDMQAAERLQKILESYKPPKSLGVKKENWRIFRDVSELQSSSDLSEIIKNAIESSEYLIVICSPQYTESKWCLQELERFRELHGNKNTNIITLLVNGDPQEAFPEVLTYTEVTRTNENGEEVIVREEVEPLAANIVADTLKESMKKLKTESLRIAAPLLGCDFNDLYQREKRREAARRRLIFGGVSGVLSLISIISIAAAVTINGKNKQIQKQNDQITEQNDQIKAQNAEIESKNSALLIENSRHLAVESENLFLENDLIPAIRKAVAALPGAGEDKPVLPEAEYALSRELGMFDHTYLAPRLCLKHESAVEQLSFMGGGKSVVSTDATGVYFWNAETGELIRKIAADDHEFASEAGGAGKLTAYFDINTDKTGTKFTKTSAPSNIRYENSPVFNRIYDCFTHAVGEEEPGTGGDVYIYNSDSDLWRIDGATGEVKWSVPKSENAYSCYDIIMYENYILRMYQEKQVLNSETAIMNDDYYFEMIDIETGSVIDTVKMEFDGNTLDLLRNFGIKAIHDGVVYVYEDGDMLKAYAIEDHSMKPVHEIEVNYPSSYVINECYLQFYNNDPLLAACSISFSTTTDLTRYDAEMAEQKWSISLPLNFQSNGETFLMPADQINYEHDILVVTTKNTISFVDYETGELIKHLPIDGEMTDVFFSRNGLVIFTLNNGEEYMLSVNSYTTGNDDDNSAYRLQVFNTNFSLCSYSLGKYVTAENFSNTAYIQYPQQNAMFREIDTGEFMYNRDVIAVTDDGSKAAVVSTYYPDNAYNADIGVTYHLFLYDSAAGECKEITALENFKVNSAAFTDSNKLIVNATEQGSTEDKTMCIDLTDGKAEEIAGASKTLCSDVGMIPSAGGAFYLDRSERNIVFVSSDGSAKAWASDQGSADKELLNRMFAVSGSKAAMYAQYNDGDGRSALIIHDFSTDQEITLDHDTSSANSEIQRIFWQNASTVGVFFNDRTVSLFDADTGSLKTTVSLDGTSQEPVSVAAISDDTFAVLCRDSNLYEMNAEGFTGRSCRLDFASNMDHNIFERDSSSASFFETKPSSDKSHIYAVWDKSQAWVLDTSGFSVRYRIDNFAAAPSEGDMVYISDANRNKMGLFPLYTTHELLETADTYLSALGEE
ncbi:MAG: TIR domain-containing protein [Oscillospiraceae bacterium]|nr:TIR domain-containing protein [Oscillospiraceae bacterium]